MHHKLIKLLFKVLYKNKVIQYPKDRIILHNIKLKDNIYITIII